MNGATENHRRDWHHPLETNDFRRAGTTATANQVG